MIVNNTVTMSIEHSTIDPYESLAEERLGRTRRHDARRSVYARTGATSDSNSRPRRSAELLRFAADPGQIPDQAAVPVHSGRRSGRNGGGTGIRSGRVRDG